MEWTEGRRGDRMDRGKESGMEKERQKKGVRKIAGVVEEGVS